MGYCHKHRDMDETEYRLQKHTHAESHLTYEQMHTDHTEEKNGLFLNAESVTPTPH